MTGNPNRTVGHYRTVGVSQHSSDRFATASLVHTTGVGKAPDQTPKWAGGGLPPMPEEISKPSPSSSPSPSSAPVDRQAMLDDPKLNDILGAIPGATVADIK